MEIHRIEVRPDRLVVEYDVVPKHSREVWDHAAKLRDDGWRLLAIDSYVKAHHSWGFRMPGTPYELRFTVLYERLDTPAT